jgi:hypothetical protein
MKTKAMSLIATVLLAASTVEAVSYVDQLDEAQEVTPVPKKKTETLAKSAAATTQSATRFPNAMLGYWCFNHAFQIGADETIDASALNLVTNFRDCGNHGGVGRGCTTAIRFGGRCRKSPQHDRSHNL